MLLGLFTTIQEAKSFVEGKELRIGDRVVILGEEQTTYEWNGEQWMNIQGIYLKGEPGKDGEPGKKGEDGKSIDEKIALNWLYERIRVDTGFITSLKGEPGDQGTPGKDARPIQAEDVAKYIYQNVVLTVLGMLQNDDEFIERIKGQPGKDGVGKNGTDGTTPKKGLDYFDGDDGAPGRDGIDGWNIVYIEDPENVQIYERELGIDAEGYLYLLKNNTVTIIGKK